MKEFFRDIFEYHNHFNQKLIDQLIENKNELTERTIPLFCHSINAQQIWNARILNESQFDVHELHSLDECKRIDNDKFGNVLKILNE